MFNKIVSYRVTFMTNMKNLINLEAYIIVLASCIRQDRINRNFHILDKVINSFICLSSQKKKNTRYLNFNKFCSCNSSNRPSMVSCHKNLWKYIRVYTTLGFWSQPRHLSSSYFYIIIIKEILMKTFRVMVNNSFKENFYRKMKKKINVLTIFFIFHKSYVKTFLK